MAALLTIATHRSLLKDPFFTANLPTAKNPRPNELVGNELIFLKKNSSPLFPCQPVRTALTAPAWRGAAACGRPAARLGIPELSHSETSSRKQERKMKSMLTSEENQASKLSGAQVNSPSVNPPSCFPPTSFAAGNDLCLFLHSLAWKTRRRLERSAQQLQEYSTYSVREMPHTCWQQTAFPPSQVPLFL